MCIRERINKIIGNSTCKYVYTWAYDRFCVGRGG